MASRPKKLRARRRATPTRRSIRRADEPLAAPGDLRLFQDFLNTFGPGEAPDELATPRQLARWLTRSGLMPDAAELTEADRRRAVVFRDGLREMLAGATPMPRELRAALDWAVSTVRLRVRFTLKRGGYMEPAQPGIEGAIGRLMVIMQVAQGIAGTFDCLGICANDACRAVFFDDSMERAATWCRPRCAGKIRFRGLRRRRTWPDEELDDDYEDYDDYDYYDDDDDDDHVD